MPAAESPHTLALRCEHGRWHPLVQVCEADSAASHRGSVGVGEGGRAAGRRTAGFVRKNEALALCTCVATPSGRPELLSPDQVAPICGLPRRAVYRAIARGDLAA